MIVNILKKFDLCKYLIYFCLVYLILPDLQNLHGKIIIREKTIFKPKIKILLKYVSLFFKKKNYE